LDPTDLFDGFIAIRIVRFTGEKTFLDALYDYAAYVGCSFGLFEVSVEVDQKPLTPRCSYLAVVQMGSRLDFFTLRAEISRSAASSFAYADG
jgi:phosphatidylglycerophosphate synthase